MAVSARTQKRIELTYRGIILGAVITVLFTMANVYLGLKIGLTFATSLPAAVISMAILRFFRNSTIWENNIVQTIASAAGTLSSIVFVLPGLVMIGYWTGFPFWQSFGICVMGGILGVMFSVPLRRAMVTGSDLPYPEGVAAAEVLRVGEAATRREGADPAAVAENKAGFVTIVWSSVVSLAFVIIIATNLFAGGITRRFRVGVTALTGFDIGLGLALIGVGHLVGLSVGIAMLAGIALAWGVLMPVLSTIQPGAGPDLAAQVKDVFLHRVRYFGAGTIGVAAIWSLGRLAGPLVRGVVASLAASRGPGVGDDALDITERDIPFNIVLIVSAVCLIPIGALLAVFLSGGVLASAAVPLVLSALVYIVLAGILVAAVCGYMAGLIGSSNSPVSGLAILTVLGAALLLVALAHPGDATAAKALIAYALFVTAIIINIATISNDNLQDLKTGQLVGATPWRQQVALIIGVVFGSLVIPLILVVLNNAYGFQGSPMHGITSQPLAAPQATLISSLAQGVITGNLPWNFIAWGAVIGLIVVAIDEVLRRTGGRRQFPPLAVALGIYLPMSVTFMVVVGAFIGKYYNSWVSGKPNGAVAVRLGILLASGFIVGESLGGVLLSAIISASRLDAPLALPFLPKDFTGPAELLGGIAFVLVVVAMYRWVAGLARRITA